MTRKDLKQYKYTQIWIKSRLETLEEDKTHLEKITQTLSNMPMGSPAVQDNMAEKLAKLMDNINELFNAVFIEQEKQKEILNQLDLIDGCYRTILEEHYVQGKNLVQVACDLNYTYDYAREMNGIALSKFDELDKRTHKNLQYPTVNL